MISKEKQIDEKNCKECLHIEACSKWTDFPKQLGFPICRNYRKQSEGEWEQFGLQNPKCSLCRSYNIEKSRFCPNCGAKMKGGAE